MRRPSKRRVSSRRVADSFFCYDVVDQGIIGFGRSCCQCRVHSRNRIERFVIDLDRFRSVQPNLPRGRDNGDNRLTHIPHPLMGQSAPRSRRRGAAIRTAKRIGRTRHWLHASPSQISTGQNSNDARHRTRLRRIDMLDQGVGMRRSQKNKVNQALTLQVIGELPTPCE